MPKKYLINYYNSQILYSLSYKLGINNSNIVLLVKISHK